MWRVKIQEIYLKGAKMKKLIIVIVIAGLMSITATVLIKSIPGVSIPPAPEASFTFDANQNDTSLKYMANVSAYCPCRICCGKWADGTTSYGWKIQPGEKFVAAPMFFALYTVFDIPCYGIVKVRDRGGIIKRNRLDVYFDTHQEALNWGRQYLEVEIIK